MNIIIAGAGKVGFNLAKTLSIGHNVIIIDKNKEALSKIQESLDILPYYGNIQNPNTYKEFLQTDIDLFIAVTNKDEANIISCMIVDEIFKEAKKFIRLQNTFYKDFDFTTKLNIMELIFPLESSSKGIEALLNYPKINNIKDFKYTDYKLISIFSKKEFTLEEVDELLDKRYEFLVGIEREKKFIIKDFQQIRKNDLLYLLVKEQNIKNICSIFDDTELLEINNCVVFGADELGISISKVLLENKKEVKVIEKDIDLCKKAEEKLSGKAEIINSKYQDEQLFLDENLNKADIFISTYKNDEYNIIKCIEAKEFGIKKVVAINNETEYYNLMHTLGIVAVRGPKISTYHSIMERINSSKIIIEKFFCGGKGVIFLRKIFENSKLIEKTIKPPKLRSKTFMIREGEILPIDDQVVIQSDDIVVAISDIDELEKIKLWIYEL